MSIEIRILRPSDESLFSNIAAETFDNLIDPALLREFLRDPRHHMAAALEDGLIVGMASAVHYVHPDKPPQLWINEVAVAPTHRRRGIGKALVRALVDHGASMECNEAWVLTDRANRAAMALYSSAAANAKAEDCVMFTFKIRSATAGSH